MNPVALIGRLGSTPQLRYTQNGTAVATCSIAVPRRRNRDEVDWIDLTFWGKTAEIASQHLTKGRQIGITGRLQQERWEKDGEKRSKVVVVVDELTFIGSRSESGDQSGGAEGDDWNPDDVPF